MATLKTCDHCGDPGAKSVELSLRVHGIAHPEKVTGATLAADACDPHYTKVVGTLYSHLVAHLAEQALYHLQLEQIDAQLQAATTGLAAYEADVVRAELLRCHAAADAVVIKAKAEGQEKIERPDPEGFVDADIKTEWLRLRQEVKDCTERHRLTAVTATQVSDAKHQAVREAMRRK